MSRAMHTCSCVPLAEKHVHFLASKSTLVQLPTGNDGGEASTTDGGWSSSEQQLVQRAPSPLLPTTGELLSEHAAGTVLACTLQTARRRRQGSQCVKLTHCCFCQWARLQTASVSLWNLRNPSAPIESSCIPVGLPGCGQHFIHLQADWEW